MKQLLSLQSETELPEQRLLKGVMGYGSGSIISTHFLELTGKVLLLVENLNTIQKIDSFIVKILPYFKTLPNGGLFTVE